MKEREGKRIDFKSFADVLSRYKYMLIVIGVGVLLLLVPLSSEPESDDDKNPILEEDYSVEALEEQLETILAEIDGAGRVNVMLTVESGMRRIFAQDTSIEQENDSAQREIETVVVSSGTGIQETVLVQQIYPKFQGALIVAEGGGDPSVQLRLTEAVAALTGLGADKISVCKGK